MILKKSKWGSFYPGFTRIIMGVIFCSFFGLVRGQSKTVVYLSPSGKDNNVGTMDQPMATFKAARDALRKSESTSRRMIFLSGEYFLSKVLELNAEDNGISIEAERNGTVRLNGGAFVTGWYHEGDKFWYADLPGVKEGTWDFRTLIVNNQLAERARYPEKGTLQHRQVWDVSWIDIAWERKATYEESTTMAYDPKDISNSLDVKNAEVRVYHMWDESLVGVKKNDTLQHKLIFSSPCISPPGAFGVRKYVIFNTQEGMTHPGQWYLDRTKGRVVYWPTNDEDMNNIKIIAPKIGQFFKISGTKESKVEKITIRGLSLNGTTIPLKNGGFGATALTGAVNIDFTNQCALEKLEIYNAAGLGVSAGHMTNSRIVDCDIHHIGGAGIRFSGSNSFISKNQIYDVGTIYRGAVGLSAGGEHLHIYRNEIYNIPYSGILIGGSDQLIEENHIYSVMQEMQDGAAIYAGLGKRIIYRGNLANDIIKTGKGFGVSSYYFDSGTDDCIMENNVSLRVQRPIHLDYTTNAILRNNTFISDTSMVLSFQQSSNCTFESNTLVASGKISIGQPNAVKIWKDNIIFRNGQVINGVPGNFIIDSTMPHYSIPARKTYPLEAVRTAKAPTLDGNLEYSEWPKKSYALDREPSRLPASGFHPRVKASYDDEFLYLGTNIIMRDPKLILRGSTWGTNDGLEVVIGGVASKGAPANFVIRIYPDGTVQSLTSEGVSATLAQRLQEELRFSINDQKPGRGGGWVCELKIPFKILGLKPLPGTKIGFNMCAYVNEYDKWHYWEGTQGNDWDMSQSGTLQLQ